MQLNEKNTFEQVTFCGRIKGLSERLRKLATSYIVKCDVTIKTEGGLVETMTADFTGMKHHNKADAKRELIKAKSDPRLAGYYFYIEEVTI